MQVRVTQEGIDVLEGSVLTSLSVVSALDRRAVVSLLLADGIARSAQDDHVWLDVSDLADRARPDDDPGWQQRFEAMIEYAASGGWTDDSRTLVRAHLEPAP